MRLSVNGTTHELDVEDDIATCSGCCATNSVSPARNTAAELRCAASCTVHVEGRAVRSCSIRVGDVEGEITTIEGLGSPDAMHPVQAAWVEHQVAQCGYCQPGQIMAAAALLKAHGNLAEAELQTAIDRAMSANLCRCGTYTRIRDAGRGGRGKIAYGQNTSRARTITRRTLIVGSAATAGVVVLGVYAAKYAPKNPLLDVPQEGEAAPTPYVLIDQDGVTIITPRADLGQGVYSLQAALVAEELDLAWEDIKVDPGSAERRLLQWQGAGGGLPVRCDRRRAHRPQGTRPRRRPRQAAQHSGHRRLVDRGRRLREAADCRRCRARRSCLRRRHADRHCKGQSRRRATVR